MPRLTWPTVSLIGLLGALALGLATLTSWSSAEILAVLGVLGGLGGGAAVVGGVQGRVDELHAETSRQTDQLQTIERQTNGLS